MLKVNVKKIIFDMYCNNMINKYTYMNLQNNLISLFKTFSSMLFLIHFPGGVTVITKKIIRTLTTYRIISPLIPCFHYYMFCSTPAVFIS